MTDITKTRADAAVSWLSGVAHSMARDGLFGNKEQVERLDGAIRAQIGRAALGAKEDARLAAARHLINGAGEPPKAACAYATTGDAWAARGRQR